MGLAVEPPARVDLACRVDDDTLLPLVWMRADNATPIPITSARLTLTFDLPDDDSWPLDEAGEPTEPERQIHVIDSTTPGDPAGWIVDDNYADGQMLAYVSHALWATLEPPYSGTHSVVVVSVDAVQRCLARGEFTLEGTP